MGRRRPSSSHSLREEMKIIMKVICLIQNSMHLAHGKNCYFQSHFCILHLTQEMAYQSLPTLFFSSFFSPIHQASTNVPRLGEMSIKRNPSPREGGKSCRGFTQRKYAMMIRKRRIMNRQKELVQRLRQVSPVQIVGGVWMVARRPHMHLLLSSSLLILSDPLSPTPSSTAADTFVHFFLCKY